MSETSIKEPWLIVGWGHLDCSRCATVEHVPTSMAFEEMARQMRDFREKHGVCPEPVETPKVALIRRTGHNLYIETDGGKHGERDMALHRAMRRVYDTRRPGTWFERCVEGPFGEQYKLKSYVTEKGLSDPDKAIEAARAELERSGYAVTVEVDDSRERALAKLTEAERAVLGLR